MNKPEKEDYRILIDNEWKDIHHSRIQEWSALGVITGAHLGIITLLDFAKDSAESINFQLIAWVGILTGIFFSAIGIFMTMRHRRLMIIKLDWIYNAELKLGLIKTDKNPDGVIPEIQLDPKSRKSWRGLVFPRLLSTSGLITLFYFALILLDVLMLITYI